MGRNFESPFIPSEEASRPGLPFFSNSFMAIRPFLGDTPDAASSLEPSRPGSYLAKGIFSIGAHVAASQGNCPLFLLR